MKPNVFFLCLFFTITTVAFNTANAQAVDINDSLALVDLYNSTDGPHWKQHSNWLTTMPVSTWSGITVTGTRVTIIYLPYNNLRGTLPGTLGSLSMLQSLRLSDNKLTGSIPASVGTLTNLDYLYLDYNQFTGSIPSSFSNLTNLFYLDLFDNRLSGSIPAVVGSLVNLGFLSLAANQFSGHIPDTIGRLVNITTLDLSYNQLDGHLPSAISNLKRLNYLYLNNNQLNGTISPVSKLVNLYDIFLHNNQFTGSIPVAIGKMRRLSKLLLDTNQLTGSIPASLGNIKALYILRLNNNYLSGKIPSEVFQSEYLNSLDLSNNKLSGSIPFTIGNLKSLNNLNLNNNQLTGSVPPSIGHDKYLSILDLSNNQLSGNIPTAINEFLNLRILNLNNNQLSGDIGFSFKKRSKLIQSVQLQHNQLYISDNVTYPKSKFQQPVNLDISYNQVTFNGLEYVATEVLKAIYSPQALIPVHQNGGVLSVSAGGALSNNTYKWFKAGDSSPTIIKGDSAFTPAASGQYYAKVINAIATQLTLYTDTINYVAPLQSSNTALPGYTSQIKSGGHKWLVYPNPANNSIYIQINGTANITLTNSAGKVLLTKSISKSGKLNISIFANGIYYLQNKTSGEMQKLVVAH